MNTSHAKTMLVAAAAGLAGCSVASAASFLLSDHPSGNENPPPYGLRLDGLFAGEAGATGGVTTFSFDTYSNTVLRVFMNGSDLNITINGKVYGGEDTGAGTGFGAGDYQFSMNYTVGVQAIGDGWKVDAATMSNFGTLTALTGPVMGEVYNLWDMRQNTTAQTLAFRQDDWRLAGSGLEGLGYFVGRGWLDFAGSPSTGDRDLLFIGEAIPTPLAGAMGGLGLMGLAARRRR